MKLLATFLSFNRGPNVWDIICDICFFYHILNLNLSFLNNLFNWFLKHFSSNHSYNNTRIDTRRINRVSRSNNWSIWRNMRTYILCRFLLPCNILHSLFSNIISITMRLKGSNIFRNPHEALVFKSNTFHQNFSIVASWFPFLPCFNTLRSDPCLTMRLRISMQSVTIRPYMSMLSTVMTPPN